MQPPVPELPWSAVSRLLAPHPRIHHPDTQSMIPSTELFVPVADVHCMQLEEKTVLFAAHSGARVTLSETGHEVWSLLQGPRRTVDRLVMAVARRSSGQALTTVPDLVREELDQFVSHGFVRRIAD
jgi:Coenzyme PQQ synthesis protein D (PqqD)